MQHKDSKRCYNTSDCTGVDTKYFCNHDYEVFGYCEECNMVLSTCANEQFLCELGEKSCYERCGPSNEGK